MTTDAGLQDDTELGFDIEDEIAAENELSEEVEDGDGDDPLAALTADVAAMKRQLERLSGLDAKVNPALAAVGRMQRIQSELDALKSRPASDPRLDLFEESIDGLYESLASSDVIDEESRRGLRAAKARLDGAKTQRSQDRMRAELLAEMRSAAGGDEYSGDQPSPEDIALYQAVQQETAKLQGYAAAKGIEWSDIPAEELSFRDGEDIPTAARRVRAAIDSLAEGDAAATSVGRRRRAARRAAPPAGGVALSDQQLIDDYAQHPERYTTPEAKKKVWEALAKL